MLTKTSGALLYRVRLRFIGCQDQTVSCATDYQHFASENPARLAKAIERGIPDTLRGMMWYVYLRLYEFILYPYQAS
jgi:hypothetical protein